VQVLDGEYKMLTAVVVALESTSLVRTTIFLGVLSAAGVALGFAAQGAVEAGFFRTLALLVLPLLLFLGVATFVRLVQIGREIAIYLVGMNRIRHFFQQVAPASKPYFVLSPHDDALGIYRGVGSGMSRRPPRFSPIYLLARTEGIVGIITGAVAAALVGLALSYVGDTLAWVGAGVAFLVATALLLTYWLRSFNDLVTSVRPINPTPPSEVGAPF
jgi:hypothetical protein